MFSCYVMSNTFATPWTVPTRLLYPWDSLGKNTGVGCCSLLQGIFLTQGLNPGLLHCTQTLYCLSYQGIPKRLILYYPACSEKNIILHRKETMSLVRLNYAQYRWASQVAQMVKSLPAMQKTWVWSLGWEDPQEKGTATHSSILAWRIPWTVESDWL